jgi:putative flippase GtrA
MHDEVSTRTIDASAVPPLVAARIAPVRDGERKRAQSEVVRPPHMRLLHGLRHPANWLQLVRFSVVGASGYAVNLGVLALCVHVAAIDYHVGAALAWIVAGVSNFILNRHWTFNARSGRVHVQAARFLIVSLLALGINELALTLFVESGHLAAVVAQIPALALSTPFNFLGNKLWSFRTDLYSDSAAAVEE